MPANPPPQPRKSRVGIVLLILCTLTAFIAGTAIQEPLAAAGLAAGAFSLGVGVFVVAPLAGQRGKQNILRALADPTEEDAEAIQLMSAHIVGNMAAMAEDDELGNVYRPIAGRIKQFLVEDYEMSLKNFASQESKGIGVFDPQNHLDEAGFIQEMKENLVGGVVEPILNSFGFEGKQRDSARAFIMMKMATAGNGNSGSSSPSNFGGLQGGR